MNKFDIVKALNYLDNGEVNQVIEYADSVLKSDRCNSDAYIFKANAYYNLGEYNKALFILSNALEQCMAIENQIQIMQEQIEIYVTLQEYKTALDICNRAEYLDVGDNNIIFTKAYLLYCNGYIKEALNYVKELKLLCPDYELMGEVKELEKKIKSWI